MRHILMVCLIVALAGPLATARQPQQPTSAYERELARSNWQTPYIAGYTYMMCPTPYRVPLRNRRPPPAYAFRCCPYYRGGW
jgi:hypothetical protein